MGPRGVGNPPHSSLPPPRPPDPSQFKLKLQAHKEEVAARFSKLGQSLTAFAAEQEVFQHELREELRQLRLSYCEPSLPQPHSNTPTTMVLAPPPSSSARTPFSPNYCQLPEPPPIPNFKPQSQIPDPTPLASFTLTQAVVNPIDTHIVNDTAPPQILPQIHHSPNVKPHKMKLKVGLVHQKVRIQSLVTWKRTLSNLQRLMGTHGRSSRSGKEASSSFWKSQRIRKLDDSKFDSHTGSSDSDSPDSSPVRSKKNRSSRNVNGASLDMFLVKAQKQSQTSGDSKTAWVNHRVKYRRCKSQKQILGRYYHRDYGPVTFASEICISRKCCPMSSIMLCFVVVYEWSRSGRNLNLKHNCANRDNYEAFETMLRGIFDKAVRKNGESMSLMLVQFLISHSDFLWRLQIHGLFNKGLHKSMLVPTGDMNSMELFLELLICGTSIGGICHTKFTVEFFGNNMESHGQCFRELFSSLQFGISTGNLNLMQVQFRSSNRGFTYEVRLENGNQLSNSSIEVVSFLVTVLELSHWGRFKDVILVFPKPGEYLVAIVLLNKMEKEDHLIAVLAFLVKNNSGCINNGELEQFCKEFGQVWRYVQCINNGCINKFGQLKKHYGDMYFSILLQVHIILIPFLISTAWPFNASGFAFHLHTCKPVGQVMHADYALAILMKERLNSTLSFNIYTAMLLKEFYIGSCFGAMKVMGVKNALLWDKVLTWETLIKSFSVHNLSSEASEVNCEMISYSLQLGIDPWAVIDNCSFKEFEMENLYELIIDDLYKLIGQHCSLFLWKISASVKPDLKLLSMVAKNFKPMGNLLSNALYDVLGVTLITAIFFNKARKIIMVMSNAVHEPCKTAYIQVLIEVSKTLQLVEDDNPLFQEDSRHVKPWPHSKSAPTPLRNFLQISLAHSKQVEVFSLQGLHKKSICQQRCSYFAESKINQDAVICANTLGMRYWFSWKLLRYANTTILANNMRVGPQYDLMNGSFSWVAAHKLKEVIRNAEQWIEESCMDYKVGQTVIKGTRYTKSCSGVDQSMKLGSHFVKWHQSNAIALFGSQCVLGNKAAATLIVAYGVIALAKQEDSTWVCLLLLVYISLEKHEDMLCFKGCGLLGSYFHGTYFGPFTVMWPISISWPNYFTRPILLRRHYTRRFSEEISV